MRRHVTKGSQRDNQALLRSKLVPGTKLYTLLKYRSRSGLYRVLDVFLIHNNEPQRLSAQIAKALNWRYDLTHEGVGAHGAGMDVGFHLINQLSYALHGYESRGDNAVAAQTEGKPFDPSPNEYRAGYSLIHRWF